MRLACATRVLTITMCLVAPLACRPLDAGITSRPQRPSSAAEWARALQCSADTAQALEEASRAAPPDSLRMPQIGMDACELLLCIGLPRTLEQGRTVEGQPTRRLTFDREYAWDQVVYGRAISPRGRRFTVEWAPEEGRYRLSYVEP